MKPSEMRAENLQSDEQPRLIEWTGERCVPWADDVQVVYEHLHRYHFAAQLIAGKRVIDLASGEGYGAAILAEHAVEVVGVDLDPLAVEHSRRTYRIDNLSFVEGSMLDRGTLPTGRFDIVTCFEAIEHVDDHSGVLDVVKELLTEDGLLFLSTPDREVYTDSSGQTNPFHARELGEPELLDLLRERFPHVELWGQLVTVGSVIFALPGRSNGAELITVDGRTTDWQVTHGSRPKYLFAVASSAPIPELPAVSTLRDSAQRIVADASEARAAAETASQEIEENRLLLEERNATLAEQLAFSEAAAQRLKVEYDMIRSTKGWQVLSVYRRARARARRIARMSPAELRVKIRARTARFFPPLRRTRSSSNRRWRRSTDAKRVVFPATHDPRVSIVIPTFNGYEITARCLAAIHRNTAGSYEVIVVDDASSDRTAERLSAVPGLRIVQNPQNLGFTESVIAGAETARGEFMVFLNNDTEVQPGWLDALLEVMEGEPRVGAAGSKLLFPDGRLQETGSIIWNDGTGANLGYGRDPQLPEYNYVRDVDYCSAAALMVRRSAYDEVGGFDRTFTPGYYEDTDLCFAIRAHGLRVVCVPQSVVVHDHGASFGSEEGRKAIGPFTKDAMHMNRHRFVAKWMHELDHHWPSGTADGLLGGRRDCRPRVLVCDYHVPARDRDSGSLRMTWIIRLLVKAGCGVSLLPMNGLPSQPYTSEFQRLGVEVLYGTRDLERLLRARAGVYDVAILSRPEVAHRLLDSIRATSPRTFVVYDTVDLHHVREARRLRIAGEEPDSDFLEVRGIERQLISRSDLVATVSADEEKFVQAFGREAATIVLPNVHEGVKGALPGFDERSDLLFIGGFQHPPNTDAMVWFVHEILPIIQQKKQVGLTILGSDPSKEVQRLAGPRVTVTGYVPDVDEYFRRACVFVAPLRYGAGVKGKVGQAMSYGLPVVTTAIGAEGMGIIDGLHAIVRDDPEEFAAAVIALLSSSEMWSRMSANSVGLVREFSPQAMSERLQDMLRIALSREVSNSGARS